MKRLLVFFVFLFTLLFTYGVIAQKMGKLDKGSSVNFPEKIQKAVLDPLPEGTYTIGTSGYFPTIDSAFKKLSIDGIAGAVILELIDNQYTAPTGQFGFFLNGPIPGAGPNSRVTIKPAANKNVTVEGNSEGVMYFLNTSYVTIDGVGLTGATTLTIHALYNPQYQWNDCTDFIYNSDHNVVQYLTFISEDYIFGGGISFYNPQTGSNASPDSNLIQNNFIKRAIGAILIHANEPNVRAIGNIIRSNIVGSETDSLFAYGIQVGYAQNTIVENNTVQNIKLTLNAEPGEHWGINSFFGLGDIIRNNVVHNIKSNQGYLTMGIMLSGWTNGDIGSNNQVYNNMVYDIQSTSTASDSRVTGIHIWYQSNPKIYYNSVYLSGTGTNKYGSAAFYITAGCTNVDLRNNILVNTRNESPYFASAIFDYTASNLISDYNDLYSNNYLVRIGNSNYITLTDWQATGQDSNSYTELPNFISSTDLHIDETIPTYLESRGTSIAGIDTDFDNDLRNTSTPDIGADEFDGIVDVEDKQTLPTEYALEQNYPNPFNPSTSIQYAVSSRQFISLKVYDVLGNEIETLVNEEKPVGTYEIIWNASNVPSGVYFYQLKAGEYTNTKKMVLLK